MYMPVNLARHEVAVRPARGAWFPLVVGALAVLGIAQLALSSPTISAAEAGAAADDGEAIDIGSRRELFVDRFLIDRHEGAQHVLHHPRPAEMALALDRPWEGAFCGYFTVIKDADRYLMYYRGLPAIGEREVTCVAESSDGRRFTRPNLGLYEVAGTRENNVVLADSPACHNFSPLLDTRPGVPADERFKALGGNRPGLLAFASADGIRWRLLRPEPVITEGAFDSQNVAFWSEAEGRYVSYFRIFQNGIRTVARATSDDFLNWSEPQAMHYGDAPAEHLYTNQTHPYFRAPHIYLSLPMRFLPGKRVISEEAAERLAVVPQYRGDSSDGVLMTTRGDERYDRTFLEAFLRPGRDPGNWVSRVNMAALNVVPTADEISIYYSQHYAAPSHHIRRHTLRADGFASVHGGYEGGILLTRPLVFAGSRLRLNYATSAAGSLRVELTDVGGSPLPGYALDDCPPISGDEIDGLITWQQRADVSALAGRPLRLRIELKDADVFALRFARSQAARVVEVRKIWDEGEHNAFTDLVRFGGRWYCAFREGKGHVSDDGAIRIIASDDTHEWESVALLTHATGEMRDPKLSITPDGRLMLLAASAKHPPEAMRQPLVWFSGDGRQWGDAAVVGERNYWLWRATWHGDTCYGVGYHISRDEPRTRLYRSSDGAHFETLVPALVDDSYTNESSLMFLPDGQALCISRRDGSPNTALLGTAAAPYSEWSWRDLGVRLGGPAWLRLPDGRIVVAGRLYDGQVRTSLLWLDPQAGRLEEFLTFPSGGDTSYPGLVLHEGELWMSYYSSHEGKTSIYLARVAIEGE